MQHALEIEIRLRGRSRTLTLPAVAPHNTAPALQRIDWLRRIADADQSVLQQAEAVLEAIGKTVSS